MNDKLQQLEARRDGLKEWLQDEAPFTFADQKHMDTNSPERAYWHHGYAAALSDALDLLRK